jgi:hypothetical protein
MSWHRDKMKQTKSISKMREDKLTPKVTVPAYKKVMWVAHSLVLSSKVATECQHPRAFRVLNLNLKHFSKTTVSSTKLWKLQIISSLCKTCVYNSYCRHFWYIWINSLKLHQLATACLTAINSVRTAELIFIKFDSGEFHTNFLTYCTKHASFCAHLSVNFRNIDQCQSVLNVCPMHFFCKSYSFQSIGREKIL